MFIAKMFTVLLLFSVSTICNEPEYFFPSSLAWCATVMLC